MPAAVAGLVSVQDREGGPLAALRHRRPQRQPIRHQKLNEHRTQLLPQVEPPLPAGQSAIKLSAKEALRALTGSSMRSKHSRMSFTSPGAPGSRWNHGGFRTAVLKNAGRICVTTSRLPVEVRSQDDFLAIVVEHAKSTRVGDPLDLGGQTSAINNTGQIRTIADFVNGAPLEGARVATGGTAILKDTGGNYFAPTVVVSVAPDSCLIREGVFGPAIAVTPFSIEGEAVSLANATAYGLAACVWTDNAGQTHRMIAGLNAGVVQVNSIGRIDKVAPPGGVKQPGNGVDKSLHAFDKYLDYKTA